MKHGGNSVLTVGWDGSRGKFAGPADSLITPYLPNELYSPGAHSSTHPYSLPVYQSFRTLLHSFSPLISITLLFNFPPGIVLIILNSTYPSRPTTSTIS